MSTTELKTPLAQLAVAAYVRASHDATTWFNVDAEAIRQAAQSHADMLEALQKASWALVRGTLKEQTDALLVVDSAILKAKGEPR